MRARELKAVSVINYLSIEEAADELGMKESAVRNYLSAGKFTTFKFKTLTLLHIDEIKAWKIARLLNKRKKG